MLQEGLLARSQTFSQELLMDKTVNLSVVNLVRTAPGHSQKKEVSPGWPVCHVKKDYKLKSVKGASCVIQLCCVNPVTNVKLAATNLPVGARLQNFWQTWLDLGAGPKVVQILRVGYTLPFRTRPNLTRSPTVISCYGITSAYGQKCRRTGPQSEISRVFQPTVLSPQTQQKMETHPRPEQTKPISQNRNIQNGDTGNHQNIPPARGVGHLHRFQGRLLPHTNTGTIQEILEISCPRANIPIQSSAFRSVHSTLGVW